jgi:hypothetical protein
LAKIESFEDLKNSLDWLYQDKKIQEATHNIYAYRIKINDKIFEKNEDGNCFINNRWGTRGITTIIIFAAEKEYFESHNYCFEMVWWY